MNLVPAEIQNWLKEHDINIWDDKYDYVTHEDHWLTTDWSDDCPKCQARGKKPIANDTINVIKPSTLNKTLNGTFDMYTSALESTPTTCRQPYVDRQKPLLDLNTPRRPLNSTITRSASKAAAAAISSTPLQNNGSPATGSQFLPPPRPRSNFELLTHVNQTNGNGHDFHTSPLVDLSEDQEHVQPVTSKIPRIPVFAPNVKPTARNQSQMMPFM